MPAGPSLYRRYRPRSFADVVGQEHVVRTLRNAIERDKIHHAYLFVGSRGTGKTSMAKILAASLNCRGAPAGEAGGSGGGPTVTPCGECDSCTSIAAATSLDVIEMDAASNNSVDDIRDLRERVAYAPVSGRHKVYILDEAHMLSTQAWNAFLKTLEEPPPSTIFVLATTEANKVLPTVVDRCHRFDFARPTVDQIAVVLGRAAEGEGLTLPDEARALIARGATGSFRDALGTLEQLVTYSGSEIVLDDVLAVLGAADAELLFGTLDAVAAGAARDALLAADHLARSGRDVGRFFADLEGHARALLICQALGGDTVAAELRVSPEYDARLLDQAARVGRADVIRLLDLLAAGKRAIADGSDPRIQLELALVKATEPAGDHSTRALLSRIERLEAALADGGAAAPAPRSAAPAAAGSRLPSGGAPTAAGSGSSSGGAPTAARPGSSAAALGQEAPAGGALPTVSGSSAVVAGQAPPIGGAPSGSPAAATGQTPSDGQVTAEGPTSPPAGSPAVAAPTPPSSEAAPVGSEPSPPAGSAPSPAAPAAPSEDPGPASEAGAPPPFVIAPYGVHADEPSAQGTAAGETGTAGSIATAEPAPSEPTARQQAAADPAPPFDAAAPAGPEFPAPPGESQPPALHEASPPAAPADAAGLWGAALEGIGADEPHLAALLACAKPVAVEADELVLAWPASQGFSKKRAEAPERRAVVTAAVRAVAGRPLTLTFVLKPDDELAAAEPALTEEELVARFVHEFQAEELPPDADDADASPQEGS